MILSTGTKRILFVLLCSSVCSLVLSIDCGEEHHGEILEQLAGDFLLIRFGDQFAVLWAPPPGFTGGEVAYEPDSPVVVGTANVTCPTINTDNLYTYNHNYASATVDYRGIMHSGMLDIRQGTNIHTENILLNLAYPRIAHWYYTTYETNIRLLYMYTYNLPCRACSEIIQNFVYNHPMIRLYVGFTELYGPRDSSSTEQRRNELTNVLNNYRGNLIHVLLPELCYQRGISAYKRSKRDTYDTCDAKVKMLVITVDITSGYAQVWFDNFNADYYGWVELLDKNNKRLTWEWTRSKTTDKLTFDTRIQYGAYVAYWKNYRERIHKSYQWTDCGLGFIELKKLPYTYIHYNYHPLRFSIKLTIKDSYPTVMIQKAYYYTPNSWDWIMIQSIDQIGTNEYRTWQWVSKLTKESDYYYYGFSLGYKIAEGFRAKYVFYDGEKYRYEGTYDNASPIWTPRECEGGV